MLLYWLLRRVIVNAYIPYLDMFENKWFEKQLVKLVCNQISRDSKLKTKKLLSYLMKFALQTRDQKPLSNSRAISIEMSGGFFKERF
jgi:hypothetical protein